MQRCSKCNQPLNEFDVSFHQALFKKKDTVGCKCLHCGTSNAMKEAIHLKELGAKQWFGKTFWLHFIPLAFTALFIIAGIEDRWRWNALMSLGLIGMLISYLFCGIAVFLMISKEGEWGDSYVTGHHYESSISSNGTIVTKQVNDYSGDEKEVWILLVFLFGYWAICLPHWIWRGIKCAIYRKRLREACPNGFLEAYEAAISKHRKTTISKERINAYHNAQKRYDTDVKKVEDNYGFMGEAEVQKRKDAIDPPKVFLQTEVQRYLLVKYVEWNGIKGYLLYKDKTGKVCGKIVINNFPLYSTSPNWQTEWDELDGAGSAEKAVETYGQFL